MAMIFLVARDCTAYVRHAALKPEIAIKELRLFYFQNLQPPTQMILLKQYYLKCIEINVKIEVRTPIINLLSLI